MGIITRFFVYILHEQHAVIIKSSLKRTGELFVNCRRENTMKAELLSIIEFMEKDRGLDRGTVIEAVEQAIETASRKIDDIPPGVRVRISPETGEITAYSEVLVVEDDAEMPEQEGTEEVAARLTLTEALRYSPEAHVGATIRIDLDIENFGRVAAQTAKQVIVQKIREAEREKILTEYSRRIGDLVHGTISRVERGNLIVDIGFPQGMTQDENVAMGLSTTGFHCVNAVPVVCEAENPGIKTYLDLPMITACMGTHVTKR